MSSNRVLPVDDLTQTDMTPTDMTRWVADEFGIVLRTRHSPVGLDITDLVGLALRRNPRRAHLLVSTVLGKHLPVDPGVVIGTGRLLGELVARALADEVDGRNWADSDDWADAAQASVRRGRPLPLVSRLDEVVARRAPSAAVVLGFAETATGLGHLVADQLRAECYLHSTRRMVPSVTVAGTFQEGHSHATDHLLLPVPTTLLDTDSPLILVDDELSTGRTAMGTITEAHHRHRRRRYVLATLIDLRSEADEAEMRALAAHLDCRIDVVSLARGSVLLPDGLIDAVDQAALAHRRWPGGILDIDQPDPLFGGGPGGGAPNRYRLARRPSRRRSARLPALGSCPVRTGT